MGAGRIRLLCEGLEGAALEGWAHSDAGVGAGQREAGLLALDLDLVAGEIDASAAAVVLQRIAGKVQEDAAKEGGGADDAGDSSRGW